MKSELGIYLNNTGEPALQIWAEHVRDLAKRTNQQSFVQNISSPVVLENRQPPQKAIIVAGDGLLRACLDNWRLEGSYPAIGLRMGGTSNTLYSALVDAGQTMKLARFLEMPAEQLQETANFHPGVMEDVLFTNTVSFNQYDLANRSTNEIIRQFLPMVTGKGRLRIAYAVGIMATAISGSEEIPLLEMYLTTPYFGYARISPQQDALGDKLTRVSIEGGSKLEMMGKLFQTLLAMNMGKPPAAGILKFEQAKNFFTVNNLGHVTLDGDIYAFSNTTAKIKRDAEPVGIFALI